MAETNLNLAKPSGSQIPSELSVVSGSFSFRSDGTGLQGQSGSTSRLEVVGVTNDFFIDASFIPTLDESFFRIDFHYESQNNFYRVIYTSDALGDNANYHGLRVHKISGGSQASEELIDFRPILGPYSDAASIRLKVASDGSEFTISVYDGNAFVDVNSQVISPSSASGGLFLQTNNGSHILQNLTFDPSVSESSQPTDPLEPTDPVVVPPLSLPKTISGYKRQFTKLGKLFDKPSTMNDQREYWFRPFLTEGIANFPSDKYPVAAVSSPNHATGFGGIYLRLYEEKGSYDLNDADSWHEWQDISELPEFSHISRKINPIYVSKFRNARQMETPQVFIKNSGEVVLWFHCNQLDYSDQGITGEFQSSLYCTTGNFPDFDDSNVRDADFMLNPNRIESDAHTGYFRGGKNNFKGIPYNYVGNTLLGSSGSGTSGVSRQYVVSDTEEGFKRYAVGSRVYGSLRDYDNFPNDKVLVVEIIHDAKREGAYNRVLGNIKNATGGGAATSGVQCEVLMDDYLNIVSRPNIFVERGLTGEFDASEISNYDEVSYAGKDYGFYNTTLSNGSSGIGIGLVEDVPHNWELHYTSGGRNELVVSESASGQIAPDWTFNQTPTTFFEAPNALINDEYNYTEMVLPQNGAVSTALHGSAIRLSDYGIIDVYFVRIGKQSGDGIKLEFGLTDDVNTLANAVKYRWDASDGSATAADGLMKIDIVKGGASSEKVTSNLFGQATDWQSNGMESATSKHEVGFRIIPSQNRLIALEGLSETNVFDITGFDYDAVLNLFIKANIATSAIADSGIVFDSVKVITYTDESIAVPSVPTIATSKTSDSVTISSSTVAGATGYKYFLDNQQNETGTFTGLEPETEYTVYARASNALGDSAPSTIQTVTTDAVVPPDTTAPVVTNNGPATITITVGDTYTPDFSTNEGNLVITGMPNTSTAGTYTVTATATDAAGNIGSATQTVIVETLAVTTPPTVVLGPNQSVQSGETVHLDASQSTSGSNPIASYEWTQTAGDTVTLVNSTTATPEFIAPSENDAQTLTFSVVAIDTEGNRSTAKTVSISVAAFTFDGSILELIDSVAFELVTDGNLMIYPGRANREIIKLRPGSDLGLVVDAEGCIDFESAPNNISKLEVIIYSSTEKAKIDSETLAIVFEGAEAHCRLGDFQPKSAKEPFDIAVVMYIEGDGRGVVVYSTSEALSTQGAAPISAYVQPSLGV